MKNTLGDLNNHLFAEMERLSNEELSAEDLVAEINRAKAVSQVATQIIQNGSLALKQRLPTMSSSVTKRSCRLCWRVDMKPYPREIEPFIAEKAPGTKPVDLVKMVNDQFGTEFTYPKMRAYLKNHKLRTGVPKGYGKKSSTSLYPREVREYIRDNYIGCAGNEMSVKLNQLFGTSYTGKQVRSYYRNNDINSGLTGRFEKGCKCWSKGKHTGGGPTHTLFQKGHTPRNHMSVGSEVVHADGYLYRKIKEPNVWKQVHRINWEEANGTIPAGMKLIFLDGVRSHVELENLMLISNAQHAVMNRQNLRSKFAEITKTSLIVADLHLKMETARRRKRKCLQKNVK